MRAARDGPAPSLMQTLTSAYRKSLVTAASLLFSNSDDADAAGVPPAPAPRAPRGSVPAFAQRTPAEKLLGEAFDLDAERAKLAAAGSPPAGLEAAAAAWQATEAFECAPPALAAARTGKGFGARPARARRQRGQNEGRGAAR